MDIQKRKNDEDSADQTQKEQNDNCMEDVKTVIAKKKDKI